MTLETDIITLSYMTSTKAVMVGFNSRVRYKIAEVIAYAVDMTENRTMRVMIFEGAILKHDMRREPGSKWMDVMR